MKLFRPALVVLMLAVLTGCPGVTPQRIAFTSVSAATTVVNDIADDYERGLITRDQLLAMRPAITAVKKAQDIVDAALLAGGDAKAALQALTDAVIEALNERATAKASRAAATRPATRP